MIKKILPFIVTTLLGVISLNSCSSCRERKTWTVLPSEISQSVSANLDTVNIFIDASKSMKGYIEGVSTDPDSNKYNLKRVVSTFVTETEKIKPSNCNLLCYAVKNSQPNPVNTKEFTGKINDGKLFSDDATLFGKMIATAVDKTCTNGVSIIFTDGIMSYPPSQSSRNVTDIENLKVEVKRAALKAKNKGQSVLIIKYNTDFLTKYYANCDNKIPKFGDKESIMHHRPFYCFMIGSDSAIFSVYSRVHKTLKGNNGMYFCHANEPEEYDIITCKEIHAIGVDDCNNNTIFVSTSMANKFPETVDTIYMGIRSSLNSMIFFDLYVNGCETKIQNGLIQKVEPIKTTEMDPIKLEVDTVNAVYRIPLSPLRDIVTSKKSDDIIAFVPKQTINSESSIFPDNTDKSSELEQKTFAFRFVTDAFMEAYEDNPTALIKVYFKTTN